MRMRTKVSIVTVVGAGVLLLAVVAVIFAFRTQVAYAQIDDSDVVINLNTHEGRVPEGEALLAQYTFNLQIAELECKAEVSYTAFEDTCFFRGEVWPEGTTNFSQEDDRVRQCEGRGMGVDRSFSKGSRNSKVIRYEFNQTSTSCPEGKYVWRVVLMGSTGSDENDEGTPTPDLLNKALEEPPLTSKSSRRRRQRQRQRHGRPRAAATRAAATRAATTPSDANGGGTSRPAIRSRQHCRPPQLRQQSDRDPDGQRRPSIRMSRPRPRRQHPPQRVSRSSCNNKYKRSPQPRPQPQPRPRQRDNRAATTRAKTKATTRDAATTRAAGSRHMSRPRPRHHHRHRRNSSHRRRSPSPCPKL